MRGGSAPGLDPAQRMDKRPSGDVRPILHERAETTDGSTVRVSKQLTEGAAAAGSGSTLFRAPIGLKLHLIEQGESVQH